MNKTQPTIEEQLDEIEEQYDYDRESVRKALQHRAQIEREEVVKEAVGFVEKYQKMPLAPTTLSRIKDSIKTLTLQDNNNNQDE